MIKKSNELPMMFFTDQHAFEIWLEQNHDTAPGIRLQIANIDSVS